MKSHEEIGRAFEEAVNMSAAELDRWLKTDESRSVGWVDGEAKSGSVKSGSAKSGTAGAEAVGHRSGRRIATILRKDRTRRTDADYRHMGKVAGYVHRHLAQRPDGDVAHTRWRYSLMNWGHDPLKR